jgi:hypothetical protein
MGDIVNAGADLLGFGPASKQAGATRYAADIGARSQAEAIAAQREARDQQIALQEPYRQAGLTGQNRLMELLGLGGNTGAAGYGQYSRDFGMQDFQQDPGYQFRLGEGLKAMSRQAGARGGLISGQTMKGLEDYRQGLASQEYGNAFNRYQTNRQNQLAPLGSLMSSGQAAASGQVGSQGQYGANVGNLMMTGGANQANAALMQGNIGAQQFNTLGRGLNQAQSMYGDKINNLFGGGGNYNTQGIQQGYDPRGYGADFGGYAP